MRLNFQAFRGGRARMLLCTALLLAMSRTPGQCQDAGRAVRVAVKEGKAELADSPLDPTPHIEPRYATGMFFGLTLDGTRITCTPENSVLSSLRIDNQQFLPGFDPMTGQPARSEPLPPGRFNKKRLGTQTKWTFNNIHLTQVIEIIPSRVSGPVAPDQKRRLDTVRIAYLLENKDGKEHMVEFRTFIDTLINTNDGALFASPTTAPGEILDGVVLKDKTLPQYLQVLENPNLKNPGRVATMTLKLGGKTEAPERVVLTSTAAYNMGGWDAPAQKAGGDSGCFLYWAAKNMKPGDKREMVWAYGGGVADSPENDARVSLTLGGSLEPGKLFTILATVEDPAVSQTLTLDLPTGMERVEGREVQPVPAPSESGTSVVLWKARVARLGAYELKVRSSTGVTQVKNISIQAAP